MSRGEMIVTGQKVLTKTYATYREEIPRMGSFGHSDNSPLRGLVLPISLGFSSRSDPLGQRLPRCEKNAENAKGRKFFLCELCPQDPSDEKRKDVGNAKPYEGGCHGLCLMAGVPFWITAEALRYE